MSPPEGENVDTFEQTARELMELVCDRCCYLQQDLTLEEVEGLCDVCHVQPAIAAALSSEHAAGRLFVARHVMKAAEAAAKA